MQHIFSLPLSYPTSPSPTTRAGRLAVTESMLATQHLYGSVACKTTRLAPLRSSLHHTLTSLRDFSNLQTAFSIQNSRTTALASPDRVSESFELYTGNVAQESIMQYVTINKFERQSEEQSRMDVGCNISHNSLRGLKYKGTDAYMIGPVVKGRAADLVESYCRAHEHESIDCEQEKRKQQSIEEQDLEVANIDMSDGSNTYGLSVTWAYECGLAISGGVCDSSMKASELSSTEASITALNADLLARQIGHQSDGTLPSDATEYKTSWSNSRVGLGARGRL